MQETILKLGVGDGFGLTLADGSEVSAVVTDTDKTPEFDELDVTIEDCSGYILGVTKDEPPEVISRHSGVVLLSAICNSLKNKRYSFTGKCSASALICLLQKE